MSPSLCSDEFPKGDIVAVIFARLKWENDVIPHGAVEHSVGRIRNLRKKIFIGNDEL